MLFHVFGSQEERRIFGGSAFVEIQFCELPVGTKEKKLVALTSISHWKNDSLYVEELDTFSQEYSHILNCDIYGINYYAPSLIDSIIARLHANKPADYEQFAAWLNEAKRHNGFYILGI